MKERCYLCGQIPPPIKEITGTPPPGCEHPKNAYCAFFRQQAEADEVKYKMKTRRQSNNKANEL